MHLPFAVKIIFAPLGREVPRGRVKGCAVPADRTIRLDPRYPHILNTFVHELLHVKHPNWSETRVRKQTTKLLRRMTWKQKAALFKRFGNAHIGEDDA